MNPWCVVHTPPRAKNRTLGHLDNQGYDDFVPHCSNTRKPHTVLNTLFPRYLFAHFPSNARWCFAMNRSRGMVGVLAKRQDRVHVLPSLLSVQTRKQLPLYALETA